MRVCILLALAAPLWAFSPSAPQALSSLDCGIAGSSFCSAVRAESSAAGARGLKAQFQADDREENSLRQPAEWTRAQVLKYGLGIGAWGLSSVGAEAQGLAGLRKMVTGEEAGKERAVKRLAKKEESACEIYKCIEPSNEDVSGALTRTKVYEMSFMAPVKWEKVENGEVTTWTGPGGATVTVQKLEKSLGVKEVPAGTPPTMAKNILDFSKAQAGIQVGKIMNMANTGSAARYIKSENVVLYTFGFKNEEATGVADLMPYQGKTYLLTAQCPTADFEGNKVLFSSMLASVSFAG